MTSSLATLTKEQLEAEAAAAYILTGSYEKAADVVNAAPSTVWRRTQNHLQRMMETLSDNQRARLDEIHALRISRRK